MDCQKIVLIGSGNVATHLGKALSAARYDIVQVYSRTLEHVAWLAKQLGTAYTDNINDVIADADVYVFAVKDDTIAMLSQSIAAKVSGSPVFIHTSGSTPMDCLRGTVGRYGVIYPLQTFSKNRTVDFKEVPCFIEAVDADTEQVVRSIAEAISTKVVQMGSDQRRLMHLSAVWACNSVNHCYDIADGLMEQ